MTREGAEADARSIRANQVFGHRLRTALEKKEMSQSELARRMRARGWAISHPVVSRWAHGKRWPGVPILIEIALVVECSVGWLLGEEG